MEEKHLPPQQESINLFYSLIVILRWKKFILAFTLSLAALTAFISLFLPPIYRAETSILPPQQSSSGLAAQLMNSMGVPGMETVLSGAKIANDLYIGLLKSRFVLDRIIDRFDLLATYKTKYREDARVMLVNDLAIENDKRSNIITIWIYHKDPKTAADMANAFVEELKNLTQGIAVTEASQRRLFFEEQLKNTKMDLSKAEESLKGFEEKTGTIEIKEQTKAIIESTANLRAQIAAKEVQRKVLMTYATSRNPDVEKIEEEVRGLKEQLSKLEGREGDRSDPFLSTGRMPATGTNYVRRLRDLKYYESLFELLAKQYEMAKIDEARDATIIQVIDRASPPEKRIKPKRVNLVLIAAFGGFFLSLIAVFLVERYKIIMSDPETMEKLKVLKKHARIGLNE